MIMHAANRILRGSAIAAAILSLALVQARAGTLYVSNFGNNTVTAYDVTTGVYLGTPVTAGAEANGFTGIQVRPDGSFLVGAQLTNNVVRYSSNGTFLGILDPANTALLNSPQGLTFGPDGNLYVASSANDQILRYDPVTGDFLNIFASLGGAGHIGPIDLTFGPDGNLYVTAFDNGMIVRVNGLTGAIMETKPGPPGFGLAAAAFGPDGNLYVEGVDLNTFGGNIYRYEIQTNALSLFIPEGSGGLQSPGGFAFGSNGRLLLANLVLDQNFNDVGTTILSYNGQTGGSIGTLVGTGKGLNIPFFMTVVVPEPSGLALCGIGLILLLLYTTVRKPVRRRNRAGDLMFF